jgi:hypothetical protein
LNELLERKGKGGKDIYKRDQKTRKMNGKGRRKSEREEAEKN